MFEANLNGVAVCDDECEKFKKDAKARKVSESTKEEDKEDLHNKREAEIFEKQMEGGRRKKRNRKKEGEIVEESTMMKNKVYIVSAVFLAILVGYVSFQFL